MNKVLYTKFSRERCTSFQIATVIGEEDGVRTVTKRALTEEAVSHVGRLPENCRKLEDAYRHPKLKICPCWQKDERTVAFPYLPGKSLEQLITEHVEQKNFGKLREDVQFLYDILTSSRELDTFQPGKEFKQLFGEVNLPEGLMAAPVSNLDMLFANILVEEEASDYTAFLVDYEWVFDFMVPITFMFARSLLLHGMLQTLPREQLEELYAIGGIKPEDISAYYQMEVSFQRYVSGEDEIHVLSKLYPKMKTCCFFLDYWNTEHVYYGVQVLGIPKDNEEAREELHFSLHFQGEVEEKVMIPGTERYQAFLFLPVDTECVLKMHYIEGKAGTDKQSISFASHNGQLNYGEEYYFQQPPVMRIENRGYSELSFAYIVYHRNDFLIKQGIDFRMQNEQLHKELRKYTGRLHNRVIRKVGSLIKRK